jgi:sugar fermentation stimulation protein A
MDYKKIVKGYFISRPNRFVANVLIENEIVACHVKNTGRCKELLVEGATLYLKDYKENMRQRKLRYSVISVEKEVDWLDYSKECLGVTDGKLLINMDSQAPNVVVKEAILDGSIKLPGFDGKILKLSMERTFGNSRFDILIEQGEEKAYIEVKGVTLEEDGISKFPDAPTIRGVKHMEELIRARKEGYGAYLIFVVQMGGIKEFRPNDQMHKEFGDVLRKAVDKGVIPMAFGCKVGVNSLHICRRIKIKLYNI